MGRCKSPHCYKLAPKKFFCVKNIVYIYISIKSKLKMTTFIINQIHSRIRITKTRQKLFNHLERVNQFTEENQIINKKELTKIVNDLVKLPGAFYSEYTNKPERRDALDTLAEKCGYRNSWDAAQTNKDKTFQALQFGTVYSFNDITRLFDRLEGHNSQIQKFIDTYFPHLEDWKILADKIEKIRTILNPTKEEKEAKRFKEIKGKVNPEIKKAIDEIAESFRKEIERKEYSWYIRRIENFKELYPNGMISSSFMDRKNQYIKAGITNFIFRYPETGIYNLKNTIIEDVKKIAIYTSFEIITRYKMKMYDKLGGFITDLNKKFTINVVGRTHSNNDIDFKFEDGSKFTIRNQIVSKVNKMGTFFYAYPTSFHYAYLPDGTKISGPSEYKVKKEFNKNG